jgi:alpha-ketoglutarate-dependent 2,4-dichlorophenoxyacetate dioxygenase
MTVTIRQLHPHFFGEVSGVDLRKQLTPQEAADIEAGMDKYAVLLFRDQDITDDQQLAFARNFGERENARGGTVTKKEDYRLTSGLNDVSNLGKDGKPLPPDHRTHRRMRRASSIPRAATRNSPTCAPHTTRSTTRPRPRSRT